MSERTQPMTATLLDRLRLPRVQDSITETYAEAADEIERLKARISELESNERAYEEILGKRTYREVAETIRNMKRALTWIVNSPSAHPANMVKVAEEGLSRD
jgi:hypothetical protein